MHGYLNGSFNLQFQELVRVTRLQSINNLAENFFHSSELKGVDLLKLSLRN
jgi:hypothetical protein